MQWNDKLVAEFLQLAVKGQYGLFKGARKIEDKIKIFKQHKDKNRGTAAEYYADRKNVVLQMEAFKTIVQTCSSHLKAKKAAADWQKKDNAFSVNPKYF